LKTARHICALTAFGLALTGCAKTPTNPNLVEARELFTLLQQKPESYWLAADEVSEAFAVLIQADLLSNVDAGSAEVDQLSQLAKQKIALAEQAVSERKLE
jgi:hypothetical protein